jgi:hypothetical protein
MNFTLDTNIPLPSRKGGRPASKYPFAEMQVGHSFLVPEGVKPATIRSAIGAFTKANPGAHFAMRTTEGGVRVWRVEKAQ